MARTEANKQLGMTVWHCGCKVILTPERNLIHALVYVDPVYMLLFINITCPNGIQTGHRS